MLRSKLFLLLTAAVLGPAFAQGPSDSTAKCSFTEIYKPDGWVVPGLTHAKPAEPRQAAKNPPGLFTTKLKPGSKESLLEDAYCSLDNSGRLKIERRPIKIDVLSKYDFKGHVFAYSVQYVCESIEAGVRVEMGCMSGVTYYDVDGSGRFTVLRGLHVPSNFFVPDWVKKTNDSRSDSTKR